MVATDRGRGARSAIVAGVLCFSILVLLLCSIPPRAHADELSDLQAQVEATSQEYNDTVARVEELELQIANNTEKLAQIENRLPAMQERRDDAIRTLYKYRGDTSMVLTLILSAQNFGEFLATFDYLDRVERSNMEAIEQAVSLRSELQQTQDELASAKQEALEKKAAAQTALSEAQDAREVAMQAAVAAAQEQAASAGGSSAPSGDAVDWSASKVDFVNEWSSRIDSYLSGSPLEGYGKCFAASAWDYGVDPRWSPAISCIESSMGAHCFRSHNAWGWGSKSWSSWEEAIDAHISGLARLYGSTISYSAAQKYCPPSADSWYHNVLNEMEKI